jgi:hypothetical protein
MSTPMTAEAKARLLEIQANRRAKIRLLKDCTPDDLAVMCDYVESEKGMDPTIAVGTRVCYLKYASPEQVAALQARIPHVTKEVVVPFDAHGSPMATATKVCFSVFYIREVLTTAVTQPGKYLSRVLEVVGHDIDI